MARHRVAQVTLAAGGRVSQPLAQLIPQAARMIGTSASMQTSLSSVRRPQHGSTDIAIVLASHPARISAYSGARDLVAPSTLDFST